MLLLYKIPMTKPALSLLALLAVGCEQSTTPAGSSLTSKSESTADDPSQLAATPPKYAPVEVFINTDLEYGDSNGCTSTFTPQPISSHGQIKHGSICGHPGAVSKLTWEYLGTDEQGDHYRFERTFPYEEPNGETTSKEVVYDGTQQLLFEADFQRILMRPSVDE